MNGSYAQILLLLVFALLIMIGIGIFLWSNPSVTNDISDTLHSELKNIRDVMINDSYLHRLLMIETISNTKNDDNILASQQVTFSKMSGGIEILGKSIIKSFGTNISQRITSLMQRRNEIIRDYYQLLSNESSPNKITDITDSTLKNLESTAREITDNVSSSFHIMDDNQEPNIKRPITHYHRLFNLISMYDKELINQAKSYADHQYDISMNCAQSLLVITHHISDELDTIIQNSYRKLLIYT